jgi:uncharacterized membrane protein YcaP (DUF421 family)
MMSRQRELGVNAALFPALAPDDCFIFFLNRGGDEMWFESWAGLARTAIVGTAAYIGLILILRASGKRTLSKMNAFDFIVTVALGSTLGTVLLSKDVPLAEGLVAFALLTGLQFVITWLSVRAPWFERLIKTEPTLIYSGGRYLDRAMRQQRVTEVEVRAAVRAEGLNEVDEALAIVLETDGSISVIPRDGRPPAQRPGNAVDSVRS